MRFWTGEPLVLEVKGQDSAQNCARRAAMETWMQAVNEPGGFGQWCGAAVCEPATMRGVVRGQG